MTTSPSTTISTTGPPSLGQIEAFIEEVVTSLAVAESAHPRPGRPTILPSLALWSGVLICVLRGYARQLDVWRLLTVQGLWSYPRYQVTDQAIYDRFDAAGSAPLEALFGHVRDALMARLTPLVSTTLAPFATEVYALDQTTLDPVAKMLKPLRTLQTGDVRLLPGQVSGLFDIRRQLWHQLAYTADAVQNEKVAARDLVLDLPQGSLIVADLGYFAFKWFDDLTDAGYFWLSRVKTNLSYEVVHTFYHQDETFDGIIWLGKHRADHAKHAVRLLEFRQGTTLYRSITNVRDPLLFPPDMVMQTYARRWDIEMGMRLAKQHLGLRMLWSAKPGVILQQVWAVLIIAQILQALRFEIAVRANVDLFDVSMPLLVEYAPRLLADGQDPVEVFVTRGRAAGFIRPSRRKQHQAPALPLHQLIPLPPDLLLERLPRYGHATPRPRKGIPPYGPCN